MPTASDSVLIANGGTATIMQLGETCGTLALGSDAGSGTVLMTAGNLSTTGYEYVGNSGKGTFTQSGGANAAASELDIGYNTGSSGTYNLSGSGRLTSPNEYIGNSGSGSFTQTGGTNSGYSQNLYGQYCTSEITPAAAERMP